MPIILCRWCEYVGQGESLCEQVDDVIEHEKTCKERIAIEGDV